MTSHWRCSATSSRPHSRSVRFASSTDDVDATDSARELGAVVVADPGGGQGEAVRAGLAGIDTSCLVVNADLRFATTAALRRLASAGLGARRGRGRHDQRARPPVDARASRPDTARAVPARFARMASGQSRSTELAQDVDTLDDC